MAQIRRVTGSDPQGIYCCCNEDACDPTCPTTTPQPTTTPPPTTTPEPCEVQYTQCGDTADLPCKINVNWSSSNYTFMLTTLGNPTDCENGTGFAICPLYQLCDCDCDGGPACTDWELVYDGLCDSSSLHSWTLTVNGTTFLSKSGATGNPANLSPIGTYTGSGGPATVTALTDCEPCCIDGTTAAEACPDLPATTPAPVTTTPAPVTTTPAPVTYSLTIELTNNDTDAEGYVAVYQYNSFLSNTTINVIPSNTGSTVPATTTLTIREMDVIHVIASPGTSYPNPSSLTVFNWQGAGKNEIIDYSINGLTPPGGSWTGSGSAAGDIPCWRRTAINMGVYNMTNNATVSVTFAGGNDVVQTSSQPCEWPSTCAGTTPVGFTRCSFCSSYSDTGGCSDLQTRINNWSSKGGSFGYKRRTWQKGKYVTWFEPDALIDALRITNILNKTSSCPNNRDLPSGPGDSRVVGGGSISQAGTCSSLGYWYVPSTASAHKAFEECVDCDPNAGGVEPSATFEVLAGWGRTNWNATRLSVRALDPSDACNNAQNDVFRAGYFINGTYYEHRWQQDTADPFQNSNNCCNQSCSNPPY